MPFEINDLVQCDGYRGDHTPRQGTVEAVHSWGITLRDRVKAGEGTAPYRAYLWEHLDNLRPVSPGPAGGDQ